MATLSAQVETTLNERSADRLTSNLESITSRAEQFTPTMTDRGGLSDQLSDRVSTGLTDGLEQSMDVVRGIRDAMGRGVSGGAETAVASVSGGAGGGGAGAAAVGGLLGAAKANPILATLGAIAGSTAILARKSPTFGAIFDVLNTMSTMILQPIGNVVGGALLPFALSGLEMATKFNKMASNGGLRVALMDTFFSDIRTTLNTLLGFISGGVAGASVGALIGAILGSVVPGIGTAVGATVGAKVGGVIGSTLGPFFAQSNDFLGSIESGITAIPSLLRQGFNRIVSGYEAVFNAIPGIGGVSLPHLASGGVVTSKTTAVVGEGGPEAVVPLDRLDSMMSGGDEMNVNVDLDNSEMNDNLEEVVRLLRKLLDKDPVEINRSRYDGARR